MQETSRSRLAVLGGCGVQVNVNKEPQNADAMIEENVLKADPLEFNYDGVYAVEFHYDQGGFKNMDLGKAYVACYPKGLSDQINAITEGGSGSSEEPPLQAVGKIKQRQDEAAWLRPPLWVMKKINKY
ncbi:MAG: hypothetical protein IKF90_25110 [Parasporobacterium sp.]|nr:hypothetical protein [Parasporobacterium sp.]